MIVRVRDLASALLMFPLALSGVSLGVALFDIVGKLFGPAAPAAPATIAQPATGLTMGSVVVVLMCLLVPAAYFAMVAYQKRSNLAYRYFGELSQTAFIALALASYLLPLIASCVIMMAFS